MYYWFVDLLFLSFFEVSMEGYIETTLVGYIADEPAYRPGKNQNYLNFTVRVPFLTRDPSNPSGPQIWVNDYWKVVIKDPLASSVRNFTKMDCLVFVKGEPRWRTFTKTQGGEVTSIPQIVASVFKILPSVSQNQNNRPQQRSHSHISHGSPAGGFSQPSH